MSSPAPHLPWSAGAERERLRVVPARRNRAPRVPFVTLVSVVLLTGVVGLLLFNTAMQQASFAATELEQQATTLSAREKTLEMELDRLRDPQRVAGYAQARGMVIPAVPGVTIDLATGTLRGPRTPADAGDRFAIAPPPPARPPQLSPRESGAGRDAARPASGPAAGRRR